MKTEIIHIRIDKETKESLEQLAKTEDRTLSGLVAKLLKDILNVKKETVK